MLIVSSNGSIKKIFLKFGKISFLFFSFFFFLGGGGGGLAIILAIYQTYNRVDQIFLS